MNFRLISGVILIGVAALFIFQNTAVVSIRFWPWTLTMSGALLFVLLFMLGAISGWLLHSLRIASKKGTQKVSKQKSQRHRK